MNNLLAAEGLPQARTSAEARMIGYAYLNASRFADKVAGLDYNEKRDKEIRAKKATGGHPYGRRKKLETETDLQSEIDRLKALLATKRG